MQLPDFDFEYLEEKSVSYRLHEEQNKKGIIIEKWILPENKYSAESVDILILLPNGYPDQGPDMFYTFPKITLNLNNKVPNAANVTLAFEGKSWQRWSRHYPANEWRPNIDGIHTFLKRIQFALDEAK